MAGLFDPITLRDLTLPNRLWLAPMCQYSCEGLDGQVGEWHSLHLTARALGGFGLLVTEATAVLPEGRISPQCAGLWNEAQRRAWQPVVESVHDAGAAIAVQLAHAGRKASTYRPWDRVSGGSPSVPVDGGGWVARSPSPVAYPGFAEPSELSEREVGEVIRAFRDAAVRAADAGFDAVEVHAAHGYLLHQFLSPLSNHRTDAYGGTLENRARLAVEVVEAVRSAVDLPILVRVSATDWIRGGLLVDHVAELGRALRRAGADLIDVSSGGNAPAEIPVGPAYQTPLATEIREFAGIPVGTVGFID
nr:NADH:flavin oxidoreductase/NADH oxidase [Actinomycetales bacterium]